MFNFVSPYVFLFSSIGSTVTSQILIKWRVANNFSLLSIPGGIYDKFILILQIIFDPFIFLGLVLTFLSGLFWMATMVKLEISIAYPFTSLGYVLVLFLSWLLLGETMSLYKVVGSLLIIMGIIVTCQG